MDLVTARLRNEDENFPVSYILQVEMLKIFFACGGQPWIAYARLLAPPRSSPGHCLAKSGRRSLIAYKAIAFKV